MLSGRGGGRAGPWSRWWLLVVVVVVESRFHPGSANGITSEPLTEHGELLYRVVAITGIAMRVQTARHHRCEGRNLG